MVIKMKMRRWMLFGLWLLSLAAISFYGGTVSYGFFFGVTILPFISLLYLFFVYCRFRIYQEVENRNMVCGQAVPYYFVLQNDDLFAFSSVSVRLFSSFSYVEQLPDGIEYELLPGDKFTYRTKIVCKYRGEYEVGVKKIIITDFFRIFRLTYTLSAPIKALVRPKIVRVEELDSITDIVSLLQKDAPALQTEMDVPVREYVQGDALHTIHWKATAREQTLKVRTRIGEQKQGISLICDTKRYSKDNREYLPLENRILEVMLALGVFFAERNITFTACYGQRGLRKSHVDSIRDFEEFYQKISEISFDEAEDAGETLTEAMIRGGIRDSKVVFILLHEWNETIGRIAQETAAGGVIVVVYLITGEDVQEYVKLSSLRLRIIPLSIEGELEGSL
ncbi:MAG: DUF58 domain-containing protein [Ruminococcus sp.]|nr:DUF58 domain-containing protein [Ruminococcus sp.]